MLARELDDDVAEDETAGSVARGAADAGARGGTARARVEHQHAAEAELVERAVGGEGDAENRTRHATVTNDLIDDTAHHVAREGESHAAGRPGRGINRGVDADELSRRIQQRAPPSCRD